MDSPLVSKSTLRKLVHKLDSFRGAVNVSVNRMYFYSAHRKASNAVYTYYVAFDYRHR